MATKLPREDVLRVADLAHLTLTEREIESFATELSDILDWVRTVQQADTAGVEPTARASTEGAAREDQPEPSIDRDEVLASAPDADRARGLFRVPTVF